MLQGRSSIFVISLTNMLQSVGIIIIYFMVFGDTAAQFIGGLTDTQLNEAWYTQRWLYITLSGVALVPVIVQKELHELKWMSKLLTFAIIIFVGSSLTLLFIPTFPATPATFKSLIYP